MAGHPLVRSESSARALALLSSLAGAELHTNELIRRTGVNPNAMQRALVQLETSGLVQSRRLGNLRLWRMDPGHALYPSIREIFGRTRGVPATLTKDLTGSVEFAFIFGSYVTAQDDSTSDIDVFVVGENDWGALSKIIFDTGREVSRELRPIVWSTNDLARPTPRQSAFLESVLERPTIWLIGDRNAFERRRGSVGTNMGGGDSAGTRGTGTRASANRGREVKRRSRDKLAGRGS